ncbi:hypothetical protein [Salinibacillus xinjiangensis]|uniref:Uncharacterized protein n=1 Tax=Salinibacillus xinjiangensis TaxID=1229268 RepID=A0A6G1XAI9_9BACI|nr:hypothetical protein [Salinibacillus xinjiangensis]MRG87916.1 hypothetical protein [Salinibacillus xinjiangensis]
MKRFLSKSIMGALIIGGISAGILAETSPKDANAEPVKNLKNTIIDIHEQKIIPGNPMKFILEKEKESKEIEANVIMETDKPTLKDLRQYKNKVAAIQKQLVKSNQKVVPATVTLEDTISYSELQDLLNDNNIKGERIFVRTKTSDGDIGGLTVYLSDGNEIPYEKIKSVTNVQGKDISVVGVYAFEADINLQNKDFEKLNESDDVFLVDISSAHYKKQALKNQKVKELKNNDQKHHIDVNVFDLYWELDSARKN